ncbi:MAG TPA: ATP-binding protein [Verrucomicrobiae bacterium]|nr:ATP-binding protein [Verrucomicrobiae bacterium]
MYVPWRTLAVYWLCFLLSCLSGASTAHGAQVESESVIATNIALLRRDINLQSGRICTYDLTGTILAADRDSKTLFFQDDSGTSVLEVDLKGADLQPGQKVRLWGTSYVSCTDSGFSLGTRPVIDADNLHSEILRFSEIYLQTGRHPIRVGWFNQAWTSSLNVAYSAAQIPKQTIPPAALFQNGTRPEHADTLPGLRYRCFEGNWEKLPDFETLMPIKTGTISNFTSAVKTRDENVAVEFKGFLEVTNDCLYKFYLSSDDGSQLFLDDIPPKLSVMGTVPVAPVRTLTVGQPLSSAHDSLWAEVHGKITFMGRQGNHVEFELSSGENRMQIEVLNTRSEIPWYLLNSRVSVRGISPGMKNVEGQKYAGSIIVANWQDVHVEEVASVQWSAFRKTTIESLRRENSKIGNEAACLHGRITFNPLAQKAQFEDATGSAPIDLLMGSTTDTNSDVECLSLWSRNGTNVLLHEAVARGAAKEFGQKTNDLPILTMAIQVQQLTRDAAARAYPVEIHGIVTSVANDFKSFLIQDSSRAVFVWVGDESPASLPQQGDFCKLEGISQVADFSPIVLMHHATVLWKGQMPQPISPSRDQLLSGSLDAQYVEIRGLVIAANDTYMTLLTADGILDLDVSPVPSRQWNAFLNSIIRVRGCLVANWNPETHQVVFDPQIRLHLRSAIISLDTPPPSDLSVADMIRASDLMKFDARFDTFRRVKVCGQVVHVNSDTGFLMDGETGLQFQLNKPSSLVPGDVVEVVGLVELGQASPVLRQAVASKIGHSPLPKPSKLSLNSLSNIYDSTLVSVEGTLVEIQNHGTEQALELQVGVKSFLARLDSKRLPDNFCELGSRLDLTGTFRALDGDRLAGRDVNSFELLLNSPADVKIIARPPWWTLRRLLATVTSLLLGLALAFIWIVLLRHQVGRRTQQLGHEITERERAEKLRAIEHERSRIARDLHDDLGSTLTEISMIATLGHGLQIGSEIAAARLREIAEKSRSMVSALDGVVWVVNSKNDTLSSLIEYLASYAEEFLIKAQVSCRVEIPKGHLEKVIAAEIRHDVMLAAKEALNNAVRHGRPTEILLQICIDGNTLDILIQDNGGGFNPGQAKGNGLGNLEQRMSKLNGSCEVKSIPGKGTSILLKLPLTI